MRGRVCCFLGHREINETEELRQQLRCIAEKLILEEQVDTFLFGSKSQFNSLCHEEVSKLKEKYPDIKRVYVRVEFPMINDSYMDYLLESYEETYFSPRAVGAGRQRYVERNQDMIDKSEFCVVYHMDTYVPKNRKSGTKIAIKYAPSGKRKLYCYRWKRLNL